MKTNTTHLTQPNKMLGEFYTSIIKKLLIKLNTNQKIKVYRVFIINTMEHPNIDPDEMVFSGIEPVYSEIYHNEPNMFGNRIKWDDDERNIAFRYLPLRKDDCIVFDVKKYDKTTGKYIDEWKILESVRFNNNDSTYNNAEEALEYIRKDLEE